MGIWPTIYLMKDDPHSSTRTAARIHANRRAEAMPAYRPVRSPLMSMGPSLEEERRRHRTARLVAVSSVVVVVVVVVLVWLVGVLSHEVIVEGQELKGPIAGSDSGAAAAVERAGAPAPQTLANAVVDKGEAQLRIQLPIRSEAITGIGFGPRREGNVIELKPTGARVNTSWIRRATQRFLTTTPIGDLRWYQLGDGIIRMVTVGALEGTEVYAPIDGRVKAVTPYVINGVRRGELIQIQPTGDGQTLVLIRNVAVDSGLQVGISVTQSVTRLGKVVGMDDAISAPLSDYTHDSGSGIDMYVLRVDSESHH